MDSNTPTSAKEMSTSLTSELEQVCHELQLAEGKIMQLELALLQSRDFAIGAAAEAGEAPKYRAMFVDSQKQLGDANAHIASHLAHIQRLEAALSDALKLESVNKNLHRQINDLKTSATWRIGKLVMTPLRVIKRIFR